MNRLRRFWALGWDEKRLFCESLMLHLIVGLLLKVVPFRRIPALFSSQQPAVGSRQFETPTQEEDQSRYAPVPMKSGVSGPQSLVIEKIRMAVQRAGWVSPWRNRCLVSSLAARCMLNQRKVNSTLSLGVTKRSDGKTIAHAWLVAYGCEVVEKKGEYTELYTF